MSTNSSTVDSVASSATFNSANSSPPSEHEIKTTPQADPSTIDVTVTPFSVVYESAPCSRCNLPLKQATETISYIGMVFAVILIVIGASVFAEEPKIVEQSLIIDDPKARAKDTESMTNALEYCSTINLCRGFYDLILYPMLWMGTMCENRRICIVWMIAKLVLFCILLIGTGFVLLLFGHAYISMCPLILLIPEFYFLWVVLCFSEELKVFGVFGGGQSQSRMKLQDGLEEGGTQNLLPKEIETGTGERHDFEKLGQDEVEDFSAASVMSVGAVKSQSSGSIGFWDGVFHGAIAKPKQATHKDKAKKMKHSVL